MYCFQTFSFQNKRICNEEHDNNPNNKSILLRLNEYIQETKIKNRKSMIVLITWIVIMFQYTLCDYIIEFKVTPCSFNS